MLCESPCAAKTGMDISGCVCYNNADPGVAQLVARLLWEQDAAGSNPVTRTMASVLTAFERLLRTLAFFIQRVGLGRS